MVLPSLHPRQELQEVRGVRIHPVTGQTVPVSIKRLLLKQRSKKKPNALTLCPFSPGSPARPSKPRSPCRRGLEEEEEEEERHQRVLFFTEKRRGLASCNVTDYLGSRLSRHAPRTVGSGSTLHIEQQWLVDRQDE